MVTENETSSNQQNTFEPTEALEALKRRVSIIKKVIDPALQSAVRDELLEHLKGARRMSDTITSLRKLLEPWIDDPTKIQPGSEYLLQANSLETLVRTRTMWAYNQGRLAEANKSYGYIIGFEFSAILDNRVTNTCRNANGLKLRKDDPRTIKLIPPLHPNCRSLVCYITTDEIPVEWSTNYEIDAALQVIIPNTFR